jgi:hypothetical protein
MMTRMTFGGCLSVVLIGVGVAGADDISKGRDRLIGTWTTSGDEFSSGDRCNGERGLHFLADGHVEIGSCDNGKWVVTKGQWRLDFSNDVDTVVVVNDQSFNVRFRSVEKSTQARFEEGADSKSDPSTAFILIKVVD